MNAIQKFIEAEHKYLDLNEIDYKEYEQMVEPLRDVECVVRCKDCKRWTSPSFGYKNAQVGDCRILGATHADWFCADGERKDGDGE